MTDTHDPYLRQVLSDVELPAISPSVDHAILAAARAGAAQKLAPRQKRWSPRFLVPAGFALVMALSVTVTLIGGRDSIQPTVGSLATDQNRVELAQVDAQVAKRATDVVPAAPTASPVPADAPAVVASARPPVRELGDRAAAAPSEAGLDQRYDQALPAAGTRVGERPAVAAGAQQAATERAQVLPADVLAYLEQQASCRLLARKATSAREAAPSAGAASSALSCTDTAAQLAALKRKYQGNRAVETALTQHPGAER